MSDDYQEVRLAAENKDIAELEVVIYPLNTNASAITNFLLTAAGSPEIHCQHSMSDVTDPSANVRDLEVTIPPAEFARMSAGVPYALHPLNAGSAHRWLVKDGLTLTRGRPAEDPRKALLDRLDRLEKRFEALKRKP